MSVLKIITLQQRQTKWMQVIFRFVYFPNIIFKLRSVDNIGLTKMINDCHELTKKINSPTCYYKWWNTCSWKN